MSTHLTEWQQQNAVLAQRGIDESTWNALCTSVYPGANQNSVLMAVDYCRARQLDVMLKPVHLVPMQVKDAQSGNKEWRDVPMPGVGLYRIQADRSGNYAGANEPEFGPEQEISGKDIYNNDYKVKYPEWCKYTVYKLINGERVSFITKEYWLENYATQSAKTETPNAMWKKRPYAQLAKCAEAQALRKAWPETGQSPTAEEMEGKDLYQEERVINSVPQQASNNQATQLNQYPDDKFQANFTQWQGLIITGKKTVDQIIATVSAKAQLTDNQIQALREFDKNTDAAA